MSKRQNSDLEALIINRAAAEIPAADAIRIWAREKRIGALKGIVLQGSNIAEKHS